jgi:hypothetical protein
MLGTIILVVLGLLVGWNTTQPALIKGLTDKLKKQLAKLRK